MDEIKRFETIMKLLDMGWDEFTADLSDEQKMKFRKKLEHFEEKLNSISSEKDLEAAAEEFLKELSEDEFLNEIIDVESPRTRHGSKEEIEETIRLNLIKVCRKLEDRIDKSITETVD